MRALHLVLAESALELVPEALWSHPAVAKSARSRSKKPRELLLEDTYHHSAMRAAAKEGTFEDAERRGRPDIVHFCLLVALESRLNQQGRLSCWIHTRDDEAIRVDPSIRVQRAQHRFTGLIEQLLAEGAVPPGAPEPLMQLERNMSLTETVRATGAARTILFDETGEDDRRLEELFTKDLPAGHDDVAVVVGGFPTGPFASDLDFPHETIRLRSEPLTAWTVTSEAVVRYQQATKGEGR